MIFPHFRAVGIDVRLKLRAVESFWDELDRPGMVHAERPLDDVKVVRAPIAILARAIIPETAPAAAIVSFHALFVIGIPRGRAEPALIVEAIWNRLFRQSLRRREFSQLGVDCVNVADPAVPNNFARFAKS